MMSKLKSKLDSGEFVISAELAPPKGVNVESTLKNIKYLSQVDVVNVTDNQRAVMHLSPLSVCHLLIDYDIEPVFQIACRDRNRLALQSDLLSAHVLGIRNVLAVSGDHPEQGDHPRAKIVYDVDSVQLLNMMTGMENGLSQAGDKIEGVPKFFKGGVVNPGSDNLENQLIKMQKKIDAGAEFFQTQLVYDIDRFRDFVSQAPKTKIIAGILPIYSVKVARFLNKSVPGVNIPPGIMADIESGKSGVAIAADLVKELKGLCAGAHIMTVGHEEDVAGILELL